jgi:dCMP deaminase
MSRISRHSCFMQVAEVIARRSTCYRRNVGALITVDNRPVSWGWNGPASHERHCTGGGCSGPQGCSRAIHSEVNALTYVPPPIRSHIATLYVTESPCANCANRIAEYATIKEVYFQHLYRLTVGLDVLKAHGIGVFRMTPAGHVVDHWSDKIIDE